MACILLILPIQKGGERSIGVSPRLIPDMLYAGCCNLQVVVQSAHDTHREVVEMAHDSHGELMEMAHDSHEELVEKAHDPHCAYLG